MAIFQKGLQTHQGLIPLSGHALERVLRFIQGLGVQCIKTLTARLHLPDQADLLEHVKMLGDGLTRDVGTLGEFGNGARLPVTQLPDEGESGFIAEGCKDFGLAFQSGFTDFA